MTDQQPVLFSDKVRNAPSGVGGYPLQISAQDLDKNFSFCATQFDEETLEVETVVGLGGWPARKVSAKIRIPTPPDSGTFVLGSIDGVVQWIATEDCD